MSALRELYQEVILDHNKNPRNFHRMIQPDRKVDGYNPLCGDHYTIFLKMDGDKIADISFDGGGCAISKASASVMSSIVKGKTKKNFFSNFINWSPARSIREKTLRRSVSLQRFPVSLNFRRV